MQQWGRRVQLGKGNMCRYSQTVGRSGCHRSVQCAACATNARRSSDEATAHDSARRAARETSVTLALMLPQKVKTAAAHADVVGCTSVKCARPLIAAMRK